jgi:hypothetical protein
MQLRAAIVPAPERGSAAVPFVLALPVMLGMMALALDLSAVYARKSELQQIADSIALAAAKELNGTSAGATNAVTQAKKMAPVYYNGLKSQLDWNAEALTFAASADAPDDEWKTQASIATNAVADKLLFARLDTSKLRSIDGDDPNVLDAMLASVLGAASQTSVSAQAIAGPTSVQVTPLAICAAELTPAGTRLNPGAASESTEYGFRRGVSYNLLDLSPASSTAQAYLVNPVDTGKAANNPLHFGAAYVKQFFCNGTVALQSLKAGSKVHVTPLVLDISAWLNARFNDFSGANACDKTMTPVADVDLREYIGKQGTSYPNWYMATAPDPYPRTAASTNRSPGGGRVTFADLKAGESGDSTPTAASFGPLWTYARPLTVGGVPFTTAAWPNLYIVGAQSVSITDAAAYPSGTAVPYNNAAHKVNNSTGLKDRRVLNIPLLDCSAGGPGAPASVVGIGRFFMTARATSGPNVVPGEFAGALQAGPAASSVALYR